jgi:hypothetical protein
MGSIVDEFDWSTQDRLYRVRKDVEIGEYTDFPGSTAPHSEWQLKKQYRYAGGNWETCLFRDLLLIGADWCGSEAPEDSIGDWLVRCMSPEWLRFVLRDL